MKARKQDNSTFTQKVRLREEALRLLYAPPIIMETHGGAGALFNAVYAHINKGVVFEKDSEKVSILGKQRPTWAVYEADCIEALRGGVGGHLTVNFLDVDPYGMCWDVIDAYFESQRPFPDRLIVVVNDGMRQKLMINGAWTVAQLHDVVRKFGNDLHGKYLDVCQYLIKEKAAKVGYSLSRFNGYYCGYSKAMTHFLAVLDKD